MGTSNKDQTLFVNTKKRPIGMFTCNEGHVEKREPGHGSRNSSVLESVKSTRSNDPQSTVVEGH